MSDKNTTINDISANESSNDDTITNDTSINDTSINNPSKKDTSIYQPINSSEYLFDYNILQLFKNNHTICITRQYIPDNNLFYFDFRKVYYPKSISK